MTRNHATRSSISYAVTSSIASASGLGHQTPGLSLTPSTSFLKSFSLCANSTTEILPKAPHTAAAGGRDKIPYRGVSEGDDDDAVKYIHPVFALRRTDYSKTLSVYSATLLVKDTGEGNFELSVCAICSTQDQEASLSSPVTHGASNTTCQLPPQLHLYCGTTDCLTGPGPAVLPMHPVMNLGSSVSSSSFLGPHCAFVAPEGIFLVDLRSANSRAKSTEILNKAADAENCDRGMNRTEKGVAFNRTKMKIKLQVGLGFQE